MKKVATTSERPAKSPVRLSSRSKIITLIIKSIEDKKGYDILSIDLKKIPEAVTDFFIICTVDSFTQSRAVVQELEKNVKEILNEKPYKVNGDYKEGWVIVDFINVVVHIFEREQREIYNLEELWGDGKSISYS